MHAESGNLVMCLHTSAGSFLGLPGVMENEPYTMNAMARKGSEMGFVTLNDFEDRLRAEPLLYPKVLQVLAKEVRRARQAFSEA